MREKLKAEKIIPASPIGVFDSGVGGLTVLRQMLHVIPNEDVIYLADTARVPYGGRPPEEILQTFEVPLHPPGIDLWRAARRRRLVDVPQRGLLASR